MSMEEAQQEKTPSRGLKLAIVATMVAVPVVYVVASHMKSKPESVQAANAPAAVAKINIPAFEAQVRSTPTPAAKLNLTLGYINSGTPGRAVPLLDAMVADDPKNADAWNNLCVAHTMQQEYNLAIPACEAGIRANSTMQLLKNNLKWAEDERAKTAIALAAEAAKPRAQRDAASYLAEGMHHLHLGEYGEAQAAWYQCLAMDPKNALAQNNIGVVFMMQKNSREGATAFQKAIAMDPGNQLFKNNLVWAESSK